VEFRNDGSIFISGYVNAVERESEFIPSAKGKFKEIIKAGAFRKALQRSKDVLMLYNHDDSKRLASTAEGNLKLYEDNIGLRAESSISDPAIIERAKKQGFSGWSFGFIPINQNFQTGNDNIERRYIEDLELLEISLLSVRPAYSATSIEIRNDDILERRYTDFEIQTTDKIDFSLYENQLKILKLKGVL